MQKSLLLEALEIVTCHWGGWVSKEDVTISKQTFRVVLYSLRRPSGSGQQFDIFFFRTSLILSKKTASVFCWEAALPVNISLLRKFW